LAIKFYLTIYFYKFTKITISVDSKHNQVGAQGPKYKHSNSKG